MRRSAGMSAVMFTPNLSLGRLMLAFCAISGLSAAEPAWQPLFNGKDLSGWAMWLGKPHASLEVPGLPRDEKGGYAQPLGAGRDPFNVFTIATVDGAPAIHISG